MLSNSKMANSLQSLSLSQIVFEYILTAGSTGHVAIDDIQFLQFVCSVQPTKAGEGIYITSPPITTSPTTRAPIPDGPYNCDFEKGLCQFTQVKTNGTGYLLIGEIQKIDVESNISCLNLVSIVMIVVYI